MNLKYFLLMITFLIVQKTECQEKCECCAYHSFVYSVNLDDFFNPLTIVKENIKTAIISTIEHDGTKANKYIQVKFQFDKNGNIAIKKTFYQGQPGQVTYFDRNTKGYVIKETEFDMDSNESKSSFASAEIRDYKYDNNSNLLKIKERDYAGKIIPDEKSECTKYEYDDLKRITREYRYLYYDENSLFVFDNNIKYSSETESNSMTLYNGKPWMQTTSRYNTMYKLISQVESSLPTMEMAWEEHYQYSENSQVVSFIRKRGIGRTECPDGDNYTEDYIYDSRKLLEKITHKYGNVICEMIVSYE